MYIIIDQFMDIDIDVCNMDDDELFKLMDEINYDKENDEIANFENTKIISNDGNKSFCKKCNSYSNIIEDNTQGITVCCDCGSVLNTLIDQTIEQRAYNDDSNNTVERCSGITSAFLPQTSLGTTISGSATNRIKKLQQWSTMPYKEKSLYMVLKVIQTKCRENGIMRCIEDDAKILYKNINESTHERGKNKGKHMIKRGRNRKSIIAACVFYACKRKGKSKCPKEIATYFDLNYTDMTIGCKLFKGLMKMKYMPYDIQIALPEHFINDYCGKLNIDKQTIQEILNVSANIQKLNIASMHTPVSVAIASILLLMKKKNIVVNKNNLAKKFKVSAVTVSKTQKQIAKYECILFNDKLINEIMVIANEEKKKMEMPYKFKLMYDKLDEKKIDDRNLFEHMKNEIIVNKNNHENINEKYNEIVTSMSDCKYIDVSKDIKFIRKRGKGPKEYNFIEGIMTPYYDDIQPIGPLDVNYYGYANSENLKHTIVNKEINDKFNEVVRKYKC